MAASVISSTILPQAVSHKVRPTDMPPATTDLGIKLYHSLVGLRGIALDRQATVEALEIDQFLSESIASPTPQLDLAAYPAQCNVTGTRLGLGLCQHIKQRYPNRTVLVDAAAYVSTSPLSLGSVPLNHAPDFLVCSFYKTLVSMGRPHASKILH